MSRQVNYVCDICGQSFDDMPTITTHLQQEHGVKDPVNKGRIDQSQPGKLVLQHTGEEPLEIDLNEWVKDHLPRQWPQPTTPQPGLDILMEWEKDHGCEATDGCWVEPDGTCEHGHPSWLLYLSLI